MFVSYIENFLNEDECISLINLGNSIDLIQMKSSKFVNGELVGENLEYAGNKRLGCYFLNEQLDLPIVKSLTNKIINLSNNLNPFKGIEYSYIKKYSFNKYGVGDFLDWHSDSHEILNGATITFIIQLNDDYDGGGIQYNIDNNIYTINKKIGSVFIFDSNISHSVKKIENRNRYSLNVWPSKNVTKSLL